jgi:hypothetical protein
MLSVSGYPSHLTKYCKHRLLPKCRESRIFSTEYSSSPSINSGVGVTVSPSPQSKDEENEKLHKLREYARDFRRQHTTDAEQFDWDSDDGDYGLAIGRLVIT